MAALLWLAIVTAIEFIVPIERHSLISRIRPLSFLVAGAVTSVAAVALLVDVTRLLGIGPLISIRASGFGASGDAGAVCVAIIFFDFLNYWQHRFQHRFLWRIHAVHHSPTQLNAASGYAHFGEKVFEFILLGVPLTLIEFRFPATPFAVVALKEILQRYIHSPVDAGLGPFNKVLVDNRFHRIHHSLEPKHFDKNFGILFSVWDRLLGTAYEPAKGEWPAVGLAGISPPVSVGDFLLFPWLRFRSRNRKGANFVVSRTRFRSSGQQQG
jgi:sterol desaturase/sphingolipid hydroxylase (fatty acid hydroxylase superfamily)